MFCDDGLLPPALSSPLLLSAAVAFPLLVILGQGLNKLLWLSAMLVFALLGGSGEVSEAACVQLVRVNFDVRTVLTIRGVTKVVSLFPYTSH